MALANRLLLLLDWRSNSICIYVKQIEGMTKGITVLHRKFSCIEVEIIYLYIRKHNSKIRIGVPCHVDFIFLFIKIINSYIEMVLTVLNSRYIKNFIFFEKHFRFSESKSSL